MDDIKNIVNKVIGNISDKSPDSYSKVERIWQNLLTKPELEHTKLIGVKNETLLVCVDSPAWMYQMRVRQYKIIKQLKEEIPDIKYIHFKIGIIQ